MPVRGSLLGRRRQYFQTLDDVPPMTVEQRNSALADAGLIGLSAIDYVAGSLDKLGRPVRATAQEIGERVGAVAPHDTAYSEFASFIPFSDTLGLTSRSNAIEGRDLNARAAGIDESGQKTWGGFFGGLGTEIALDPLTYLTLGGSALTKSGKVAKAAGLTDDAVGAAIAAARQSGKKITSRTARRTTTIADAIAAGGDEAMAKASQAAKSAGYNIDELMKSREPLQGLVGVGAPFREASRVFAPGLTKYDQALNTIGVGLRDSALGRGLSRAFDPSVLNTQTVEAQAAARPLSRDFGDRLVRAKASVEDAASALHNFSKKYGVEGAELDRLVQRTVEGFAPQTTIDLGKAEIDELRGIAKQMRSAVSELREESNSIGLNIDDLGENFQYFPRRLNKTAEDGAGGFLGDINRAIFGTDTPATIRRKAFLRGTPEGTDTLNQIFMDTDLWDRMRADPSIWDGLSTMVPITKRLDRGKRVTPLMRDQIKAMADSLGIQVLNPELSRRADVADLARRVHETLSDKAYALVDELAEKHLALPREKRLDLLNELANLKVLRDSGEAAMTNRGTSYAEVTKQMKEIRRRIEQPMKLAEYVGRTAPSTSRGKPMFVQPLEAMEEYLQRSSRAVASGHAVMDFIADNLIDKADAGDAFASAGRVLHKSGFGRKGKVTQEAFDALARRIADRRGIGLAESKLLLEQGKVGVAKPLAKDMVRLSRAVHGPGKAGPLGKIIDKVTGAFRFGVTQPWPAFHVRNRTFGAAMNWIGGASDPTATGFRSYTKPWIDAASLRTGKIVQGAGKIPELQRLGAVNDETATTVLGELMHRYGLSRTSVAEVSEQTGHVDRVASQVFGPERNSLDMRKSLAESVQRSAAGAKALMTGKTTLKDAAKSAYTQVIKNISDVSDAVEFDNRASAFIAYLRQGWTADAASAKVKALHADYAPQAFTQFENAYLRGRFVPFYSFARKIIPTVVKEYLEKPGGKLAALTRAQASGTEETLLPEHMTGSIRAPWDQGDPRQAKLISEFGLPTDLLDEYARFGPTVYGTAERTGRALLGQLNPFIKIPAEYVTGREFFTGRDTLDTTPTLKQIARNLKSAATGNKNEPVPQYGPLTEKAIHAADLAIRLSPLARAATTARRLTDPRKTGLDNILGLTTGVRVSDVDLQQQQAIAGRELLGEVLRGSGNTRTFQRLYVPKDQRDKLSKKDRNLLLLYESLMQ